MDHRRSLLDDDDNAHRTSSSRDEANVFGDEHEVDDGMIFDGMADGYRPQGVRTDDGGSSRGGSVGTGPCAGFGMEPGYANGRRSLESTVSRGSTRKARPQDNPFASPEDEGRAPLERTPSGNFAPVSVAHRSVSSASSAQFARTGSPRFGAGPSHPYEMYPQGTLPRTPSVTTTSTVRAPQQQSTTSRDGPQHPYALYPQTATTEEEDLETEPAQNPVPVGFTGLGQSYRRVGPDGEEQDIIGAYGHTEQLPPYTRYPEGGPEKVPLLQPPEPPAAPDAIPSRAPVQGTDPSMPLMHTTLVPSPGPPPPPQSMMDESRLSRAPSTATRGSRQSRLPFAEQDGFDSDGSLSNKSWKEKSWKEKRNTRVAGVRLWCIVLAGSVAAFIAIVVGGVIGGFVEGRSHSSNDEPKSSTITVVTETSIHDASLIATPSTSAPPTGTYALSLSRPQETYSSCLADSDHSPAWSCDFAGDGNTRLVVAESPGGSQVGAYLYYDPPDDLEPLYYGTQSKYFNTTFTPFLLVRDNDNPEAGNAFYFQNTYDKVVVIPGDALDVQSGKIKRDDDDDDDDDDDFVYDVSPSALAKPGSAEPGDRPWFCFWNNTSLEIFIYTDEPLYMGANLSNSLTASSITGSRATAMPMSADADVSTTTKTVTDSQWSPTVTYAQSATFTTTISHPTRTGVFTGAVSKFGPWLTQNFPGYVPDPDESSVTPPATTDPDRDSSLPPRAAPHAHSKRARTWSQYDYPDSGGPATYPYLLKLEERRVPGAPAPYCVQYQFLENGLVNWIPAPDGEQIIVPLSEENPPYSLYDHDADSEMGKLKREVGRVERGRREKKRSQGGGQCHCQWMSGEGNTVDETDMDKRRVV